MNITKMGRNCILLNRRAYVDESLTVMELLELEEELKKIDSSYSTVFQTMVLFKFYKDFGMPASILSVVSQIVEGNSCVIGVGNSSMKITRVSRNFCVGEWVNCHQHIVQQRCQQMHSYHRSCSERNYEEQGHKLLCN